MNLASAIVLLALGGRFLLAAQDVVGPPQLVNLILAAATLLAGIVLLARALRRLARRGRRLARRLQRYREAQRALKEARRRAKVEWQAPVPGRPRDAAAAGGMPHRRRAPDLRAT
jgi:hypothetical protein